MQTLHFIPVQIVDTGKLYSNLKETKRSEQLLSLLCVCLLMPTDRNQASPKVNATEMEKPTFSS